MVAENELIVGLNYREYAQCEFSADLALVPEVAGKMRTWCLSYGLDPEDWAPVELALVEGLNNAVEHGCHEEPAALIRLRWHWTDEVLEIQIHDPSQFEPAPAPARLPDLLSERGRGLFVMSTLMDEVSHTICDGQHVLQLRKYLGPSAGTKIDVEATLRGMTGELQSSHETISALFRFGEELATARSFEDFSEQVLQRLLKLVSGDEAWLRLGDRGGRLNLVSLGQPPRRTDLPESLHLDDPSVEAQVFRESDQQTIENSSGLEPGDPLRRDHGSAFVCPIVFRGTTIGVLAVQRERTVPYFTAGDARLIGAVADFLGIARKMALSQERREVQQRTERELEIAAEIQRSLLPRVFPDTGRFRIFGLSQTAHAVGGDYFDVLPIGDKGVLLAIADVMGKGMPAALLATILRTAIRAHSELAEDPGQLLTVVNQQLGSDLQNLDMFITVQLAFLSNETNELRFASAGHCPLLRFSRDAPGVTQSRGGGVPLGVLEAVEYETLRDHLTPGDHLVLLSDGLYEAPAGNGQILGLDALALQLPAVCGGDPRDGCRRLLDYVARQAAGQPAADDRTVLIAEFG